MADPHWDDLKVFLAVAREESLSGAGRILRMDPATVGRRINRLEATVEASLFVKSPQGYRLSNAGERLLSHSEAVEQAMRAGLEAVAGPDETLSGQIRIGAPDGCANYLLPQVCAAIGAENPGLDIQIVALPRIVNLSRREADMAITVSPPTAGQLNVRKLSDYHLHLAASEEYLSRAMPLKNLEDLKDHRIIGYIPDMIFDLELDYLSDLDIARVPLASNSVAVQLRMVAQGAGLCVAHDFALPFHSGLRKVLTSRLSLRRSFYLVRHQSDRQSDRLNRFAHALGEGLRAELARLEALT
ncbi:MAG: LysR family transcriptional regulator [Arenibacterium sp.]